MIPIYKSIMENISSGEGTKSDHYHGILIFSKCSAFTGTFKQLTCSAVGEFTFKTCYRVNWVLASDMYIT